MSAVWQSSGKMKDFRFLAGIAKDVEEIPVVMESLLLPYQGKIAAFHHDIQIRGQQYLITYTIQLRTK